MVDCSIMRTVGRLSTEVGPYVPVDFRERMITSKVKEVSGALVGRQPGSSLTRPCAASVQRAPLLLQWRGGGSRDALQSSVPLGTAVDASPDEDGGAEQSALSD